MAMVVSVSGNHVGLFIRYEHGYHLREIHDVAISSPSTDHVLAWNGTSSRFENKAASLLSSAKWATGRTLTLSGDLSGSVTFDGSAPISLSGTVDATSLNTFSKIVKRDSSGNFSASTITAELSGNASTATKLAIARTISLSGGATGSASFDGSGNITIDVTVTGGGVSLPQSLDSQATPSFNGIKTTTGSSYAKLSEYTSAYTPGGVDTLKLEAIKYSGTGKADLNLNNLLVLGGDTKKIFLGRGAGDPTVGSDAMNTDVVFLQVVDVSTDVTELRVSIGDNNSSSSGDSFVIGSTLPNGTWNPIFRVNTDGYVTVGSESIPLSAQITSYDSQNTSAASGTVSLTLPTKSSSTRIMTSIVGVRGGNGDIRDVVLPVTNRIAGDRMFMRINDAGVTGGTYVYIKSLNVGSGTVSSLIDGIMTSGYYYELDLYFNGTRWVRSSKLNIVSP